MASKKNGAAKKVRKTASLDETVVKTGRGLAALLKKHQAKITKYNAKLMPPAQVTAYAALIRQTTTAITEHQSGSSEEGATLAQKRAAIAALIDAASTLREEVRLAAPDDDELHRAVGVGMRLSSKVSKDAIALAALQQKNFEDKIFGARMRAAGITQARVKALETKRRAVAGAETARGMAKGEKRGEAKTKDALVRDLAKANTRAIDVGVLVFKDDPKTRAQYEQYRTRRPRKKNGAQKSPPVGTGGATPPSA